jgi:putative nucleotidyltransferase with HDIG domain
MDSLQETKRISLSELCPDMILAKDAVSKSGVVILTKNTRLDKANYKKLEKTDDISKVEIWTYSIDKRNKPFSGTEEKDNAPAAKPRINPILKKPEFKRFHDTYNKKLNEYKNCVKALKNGENANQEELYGIVEGLVDTANCASDLIHYISYLNKMDDCTYSHSINVAVLSHICATWLHLEKKDIEKASVAGLLHDIGKTSLDLSENEILNGETLSGEKLDKFKKHPEIGYELLIPQDLDDDIKQAVLSHHEKIDGSGYPKGLTDKNLNEISKIVTVCNAYDNLVSIKKRCPFDIINDFEAMNIGRLDTKTLFQFTKNITYTYVSSYVQLSNNKTAQIVFINQNFLSRPIVVTLDGTVIDLAYDKTTKIVSMA